MALEPIRAALFDMRTGDYIRRVPVGAGSTWSRIINAPGEVKLTLPKSPVSRLAELHDLAKPWQVAVALMRGRRILQAGPVIRRPFKDKLTLDGAGYWQYLDKRLVLNHALAGMTIDGEVLIDEENPAPEWVLSLTGSYVDIAVKLMTETAKWQPMPVDLPPLEGGIFVRNYYGYDLARVSERLKQLTELQNGPELRFDPYLRPDGGIQWRLEGDLEILDNVWEWNTAVPEQGIKVVGLDDDGDAMANDGWGQGGRNDDILLMTRRGALTPDPALPLLQEALTGHSTVSDINTLRGHTQGMVERSMNTYGQVQLEAPLRYDVQPGDWVDLRTETSYMGRTFLSLKVVGVSGGTGDRQKIDTRVRYDG